MMPLYELPVSTETPLYRCLTKGVKGAAIDFQYGPRWITAKRAVLKIFPDRIECGSWKIRNESIEEAVLFETKQWFMTGYILKIRTADNSYQFGLNSNDFWRGALPFPVERTKGRLKYSTFSIITRIVPIIGIIWYVYFRNR